MKGGLRRFVAGAAPPSPSPDSTEQVDRCEMCTEPIGEWHGHVVDVENRGLMCTCRPCALLFTQEGAARGRYKAVPERYRYAADVPLAEATWDAIGIPVGMAFFFTNSAVGRTVAFYPSPAGATESLLSLEAWTDLLAAIPELADLRSDVEALLVHKAESGFECFAIPIDVCYQLVGLVRMHWKGFDGGEEAWAAIHKFFAGLRERSELVVPRDVSADG
ncbi:MAG: DUF5947 family protein [Actinomycetota bacterium]|nr:DUF5947 family protein [Actinomycetota bacterium]